MNEEIDVIIDDDELTDIMKLTNIQLSIRERLDLLNRCGNFEGVCRKLKTNPLTGLLTRNKDDLARRVLKFGTNELPKKKAKSFLMLVWQALHDKLLVILFVCALISIILPLFFKHEECLECVDRDRVISNALFRY